MTTAEELVQDIRWKAMRLRGEHMRTSASHLDDVADQVDAFLKNQAKAVAPKYDPAVEKEIDFLMCLADELSLPDNRGGVLRVVKRLKSIQGPRLPESLEAMKIDLVGFAKSVDAEDESNRRKIEAAIAILTGAAYVG